MCDDLPPGWELPSNTWYLRDEIDCIVAEVKRTIRGGYTFTNRLNGGINFADTREEIFAMAEESVRLAKERYPQVYKGL